MNEPYRQEADVATLGPNRKYCYACASVLDVRAELCPRCGVRQAMAAPMPPQQYAAPQMVIVSNEKSAGVAAMLAFFFGPLGMLYSTALGALVMFIVNILVVVGTAGIGLVVTIPISMIWAASAANAHNLRIRQTVMPAAFVR
jgi:hypothetical protein